MEAVLTFSRADGLKRVLFDYPWLLCFAVLAVQTAVGQGVVINEIMPRNRITLTDEDGAYPDWFELRNRTQHAVALQGFGLSDDLADKFKWVVPDLILPGGSYALFYASGKDRAGRVGFLETVIDQGDLWRYRSVQSEPSALWTDAAYAHADWEVGVSGIGYGDADIETTIGPTLALYLRREFQVHSIEDVHAAYLHMIYDDAFVAYLNGVEIARANIDKPDLRPTHDDKADRSTESQAAAGLPPETYEIATPQSLLRKGTNILAIQVHNEAIDSSDLSVTPFLTLLLGSKPDNPRGISTYLAALDNRSSHTNFKLDADGEALYLTNPNGLVVDSVAYGSIPTDISYARSDDAGKEWALFSEATPGAPNAKNSFVQVAAPPEFSQAGGSGSASVQVTLASDIPEALITYTLDGSMPTMESSLYEGEFSLGKTAVVRARTFGPDVLSSPVATRTFLVDDDLHLPVVSLTTEPANLWDEETGIYVKGRNAEDRFPYHGANFFEDWEIPVHVELIDTDGQRPISFNAGSKIAGNWSRGYPQKPMAIIARGRYGKSEIEYPLFEDRPFETYQSFLLRNGGNNWGRARLRDGLTHRLVEDTEIDVQSFRPVVVYLNGDYWGILHMREKVNEHYASARGGVDADEIDMLEVSLDAGLHAIHGSMDDYLELVNFVEGNDWSDPGAYMEVQRRMDLHNFIDYQIAEIFFNNRDWPGNNVRLWRPQIDDGQWRWILYDTDFGFGFLNATDYMYNTLLFATAANGPEWPNPPWSTALFRGLLENAEFEQAFVNRFADFLNVHVEEGRLLSVIDELANTIAPEMQRHKARWGGTVNEWKASVEELRVFARNRKQHILRHVRNYFRLGGLASVALDVEPAGAGSIKINREVVTSFPWSGEYFERIPVTVKAIPNPGYRFDRWVGVENEQIISQLIDSATRPKLKARFVVHTGPAANVVINEIQYNAADEVDTGDWIELFNLEQEEVDLSNWSFTDAQSDHSFSVPDGTLLPARSFIVLSRDKVALAGMYPEVSNVVGNWNFGISGNGEHLRLYDWAGVLVDSLTYGNEAPWPVDANGGGYTLELIAPESENSDVSNWHLSASPGGTPGYSNGVAVGVVSEQPTPSDVVLYANFPNPFSSRTAVVFGLPRSAHVTLSVHDVLGKQVAVLIEGERAAGRSSVHWDASDAPSGVYVIRLAVNGEHEESRVVVCTR